MRFAVALVVALALLAALPVSHPAHLDSAAFVRINQAGYLADDAKTAFVLSYDALDGRPFRVVNGSGAAVFEATIGDDQGPYGAFAHLYRLDFSALDASGSFRVSVGEDFSPTFTVGPNPYGRIVDTSLQFFRVQRCGDTDPLLHGPCHLCDAEARVGDGRTVNVSGGWHDAGDYLKFLLTHGGALDVLLSAYQRHPEAFATAAGETTPAALVEARVGLDWMAKTYDPAHKALYYQVGDESDHEEWRLPEGDDANRPTRRVFACEPGKGANLAGKAAAAFALAAAIWGDDSAAFHDEALATHYAGLAVQFYKFGKKHRAAQSSTDGFYGERTWTDDMTLAAAELYRATGEARYLRDARKFAKTLDVVYNFDFDQMHSLAQYELARVDSSYVPRATEVLAGELEAASDGARQNPFGAAVGTFFWGCAPSMAGAGLEALWYEDLTGDASYRALASSQRDFALGMNPWGVSMVNGAGTTWVHSPHHQVSDITGQELVGFWSEGPARASDIAEQEIELRGPDEFATFQIDSAVFHDDVGDYVTNEPTIFGNAVGIAFLSWYAAR